MVINLPTELIIFIMCALIGPDGYDCDEMWVVYWYTQEKDVFDYCYPGEKRFHWAVAGCAVFDTERGHYMIFGSRINDISHTGHTVLAHELLHMKCLCDFHANPPEEPRR